MEKIETKSDLESKYGLTDEERSNLTKCIEQNDKGALNALMKDIHPADTADFVDNISNEERERFVKLTKNNLNPEILVELSNDGKEEVIDLLGSEKSAKIINNLKTGDAVDVMEDLGSDEQDQIIKELPRQRQNQIKSSLAYPEDSAGRLVNKKIVSIPEFWTVRQTIDFLRSEENTSQNFYQVFLTNPKMKPSGAVLLSRLITAEREEKVVDLQHDNFKVIPASLDQEEVAFIFRQYGLSSAPVVNETGRMIGVIDINDIVGVIEEEAQEDIMHLGGISETDIYTDFFSTAKRRLPWLATNLITAIIASFIIAMFEGVIEKLASLAVLMPIVASMGGNAGTQSVTVTVRSIATKQLDSKNALKIVRKELYVGAINGLMFATLSFVISYLWFNNLNLSLVFSNAIFLTLTFAGVSGTIVPLLLVKFGVDPAIASSVVLTTITDILAFSLFLSFATLIVL